MPAFRVTCLVLLLTLAACSSASAPAAHRGEGYGPPPENAASAIAALFRTDDPPRLSEPDPYPARIDGRWLYGWRVCAFDAAGGRHGLFLFRREQVVFQAIGDGDPESRASVLADRHCSGRPDF